MCSPVSTPLPVDSAKAVVGFSPLHVGICIYSLRLKKVDFFLMQRIGGI